MAINVRLPEELDRQLSELAEEKHVSVHALLLAAAESYVLIEKKTAAVLASVDSTRERYADTIKRLEDA